MKNIIWALLLAALFITSSVFADENPFFPPAPELELPTKQKKIIPAPYSSPAIITKPQEIQEEQYNVNDFKLLGKINEYYIIKLNKLSDSIIGSAVFLKEGEKISNCMIREGKVVCRQKKSMAEKEGKKEVDKQKQNHPLIPGKNTKKRRE